MILRNLCCRLLTGFLFASAVCAHAEITTDGSRGPALDLPGPDFHINAGLGQQHGANLFHSFRDFHIRQGESATFTGPESVGNVISRVTGGTASELNGVLPPQFIQTQDLDTRACSAADAAKTSRFAVSRCRSGVPVRGRGDLLPPTAIPE